MAKNIALSKKYLVYINNSSSHDYKIVILISIDARLSN